MAPSSSSSAAATSVQVALRIRPPTKQDAISIPARFQRTVIHAASPTQVTVDSAASATSGSSVPSASTPASSAAANAKKQVFSFDQVHGPDTTQHALFTTTALPLLSRFIEGFNCTILAYGQTSSGKTFTMTGIDLDANPSDPNNGMGIIPRAVSTIFQRAREVKEERGNTWNYTFKGSFIELYNEDLIDLLGDGSGGRREVQIRENKDGSIIWDGLREVTVRNPNEVMNLIRQGTSIRRTNETDMNAQSSRSHAIFSLTLIQRKYSGASITSARSSSPLPPTGRSPSRIGRPASVLASNSPSGNSRISSPTFGRPGTPSFQTAMGRGGLRPSSALGHSQADSRASVDEDAGEWTTVVSKFHFVDLAGSERIKKTAAAGERIKEGISINSGLLALGNVISALGDPARAKSHTASYVPYRDSKLTRLLQDSLGGNAHTLMIACVSAAEYNALETVNTLKYANRARNIKNRAVINEKEEGWDDVEWLQGMVTRLRKEVKAIKEGGPITITTSAAGASEASSEALKKALASFNDVNSKYEELREKYVARNEELNRLRREHGEHHRSSTTGTVPGMSKYEEIVGPVIEEYEKTISAMEAELSLNRAALRHTNELVEEKEEELNQVTERKAATEMYVEELRARVLKLTEREQSTEAYVHDLEERIKQYDESNMSSSGSITDLKRELAKFKDSEAYNTKYISDLEIRLARADESVLELRSTVEKLEGEAERRRLEVEVLQERLVNLQQDGDAWRTDLEEREKRVSELEKKMEEWEAKRKEAGEARERLGVVVDEVTQAQKDLKANLTVNGASTTSLVSGATTPKDTTLEDQMVALQQTHTATLADLSSVTEKYRDALREISDLAAQIQELKLSGAAAPSAASSEVPDRTSQDFSMHRRRMTGGRVREASEGSTNAAGRRLFFRQAVSTESLHSRSLSQSQSLSQELSSARSRKASISSTGTSSATHSPTNSIATPYHRPNLSISLSSPSLTVSPHERSVSSLEKEIMRLQDVLKEREQEIAHLEISLKEKNRTSVAASSSDSASGTVPSTPDEAPLAINGHAHHPSEDANGVYLSPKTMNHFDEIRSSMRANGVDSESASDAEETMERLNELMRAMAQKESQHREVVDGLNEELRGLRRQHDDLSALSRDQALNMSNEMEALRAKHEADLEKLQEIETREAELQAKLTALEAEHASSVEQLRAEHEEGLRAKEQEVDELIARLKEEHDAELGTLRTQLEEASAALEKTHQEHAEAFGRLKSEHEEEVKRHLEEAAAELEKLRQEHEAAIQEAAAKHEEALKMKDEETSARAASTEEEYYNGLTKMRAEHAEALKRQVEDSTIAMERLKEEHADAMRQAEMARDGSLAASESSQSMAIKGLQDEHAASVAKKEAAFAQDLERVKEDHARALSSAVEDHAQALEKLKAEHETAISKAKEEAAKEIERLTLALSKAEEDHAAQSSKAKEEAEAALLAVKEQQEVFFKEVQAAHEEELAQLRSNDGELQVALSKAEAEREALAQAHAEETAKLRSAHEQAMAELNAMLVAEQDAHRQALEESRSQTEQLAKEEQERLQSTIAALKEEHARERETFQKDHELMAEELASYKATVDEHVSARDEAQKAHEIALSSQSEIITNLQQDLSEAHNEREELAKQIALLTAEVENSKSEATVLIKEASKRESLYDELEKHRSVLAETQTLLQRVRDEKDAIQEEKNRQEQAVRELQEKLAAVPPVIPDQVPTPTRPHTERGMSFGRLNGIPPSKLPPPTPPPSVPPPPAPRVASFSNDNGHPSMSSATTLMTATSSRDSQLDSPATSLTPSFNTQTGPDPKILQQLEEQTKQIHEQEVMIKTLNKQLTHCEGDLQAHMDLVTTLETSLGDSEKNLRKARMQATELARERDTLNGQIEALRREVQESKREVANVRKSVVEEKQSLESRLEEERRAKERARQQLDSRMEELQKRKSKFACL